MHGRGQVTEPGRFPYSFREVCEFFKVPRIGLVKAERLGQRLNVPTQGLFVNVSSPTTSPRQSSTTKVALVQEMLNSN